MLRLRASNSFIFYFETEADKRTIFLEGPWQFNNSLVILDEPKEVGGLGKLKFDVQQFWIRIYNVLLLKMSRCMALQIG